MKRLLLILCLIGIASSANAALLNTELVVNGGAETGDTTGWVSTGIDSVAPDIFAQGFGSFAFTGGTGPADGQTLLQTIDVSGNSNQIDSNEIESIFSIQLQSRSDANSLDLARVDVSFLDSTGAELDSFAFIDDINTNLFDWNLFSDIRLISSGTRSIDILLTSTRTGSLSSDGFFDNASFQMNNVSTVPAPAAIWLFSTGIIGLIAFRKNVQKTA